MRVITYAKSQIMNSKCVIEDNFQLHVSKDLAKKIFGIDGDHYWNQIDGLPDLLQVVEVELWHHHLIALTTDHQLLLINSYNQRGVLFNLQLESVRSIAIWELGFVRCLVVIDNDDNAYYYHFTMKMMMSPQLIGVDISSQLIDRPSLQLLDKNVKSMITCQYSQHLIWLNHNGSISFCSNRRIVTIDISQQLTFAIEGLLVDDNNIIYRLDYEYNDKNNWPVNMELIKLFQVDYKVKDVAFYPDYDHISTIDDNGQLHQYTHNSQLVRVDDRRVTRFIRLVNVAPSIIEVELEDGRVPFAKNPIEDFKLINLEEYYRLRPRSARMDLCDMTS